MRKRVDHARPYVGLALHDVSMDHLGGMKNDVRDWKHGAGEEIGKLVLLRDHTAVCNLVRQYPLKQGVRKLTFCFHHPASRRHH